MNKELDITMPIFKEARLIPVAGNILPDYDTRMYQIVSDGTLEPIQSSSYYEDYFHGFHGSNVFILAADLNQEQLIEYKDKIIPLSSAKESIYGEERVSKL